MRKEISTTPEAGYSTQADLSLRVADRINSGRIDFYFATGFNPATIRLRQTLSTSSRNLIVSSEAVVNPLT